MFLHRCDAVAVRRRGSNYGNPNQYSTFPTVDWFVPAIGTPVLVEFNDVTNIHVNDIVTVVTIGTFQVLSVGVNPSYPSSDANSVVMVNLTGTPTGSFIKGSNITGLNWSQITRPGLNYPPVEWERTGLVETGFRSWTVKVTSRRTLRGERPVLRRTIIGMRC